MSLEERWDCDTCAKRVEKTGNICLPRKDGACAWYEEDEEDQLKE